ncbi:MAG: hypothetical protein Q9213_002903 [Squamulea squamosa]
MASSHKSHYNGESKDPPVADEITYHDKQYSIVREGLADILNLRPADPEKGSSTKQSVFYNPIQQFNRDLSVLAIRIFAEDLAIIRRARHDRRLQNLAKDGKKATKRKRGDVAGAENTGDPNGNKKREGLAALRRPAQSDATRLAQNAERSHSQEEVSSSGSITASADHLIAADMAATPSDRPQPNGHVEEPPTSENTSEPRPEDFVSDQAIEQNGVATTTVPPFRILDALSATGLRALRYTKEISHVTSVTANDLSPSATTSIKLNAEYNGVSHKIQPTTGDAKALMYHTVAHSRDLFHVIDLDPYGTAVPFLDAAVQAVPDGGLLCVTCTDAGVFASVGFPEKSFSQYGGISWKGTQCHEAGLRLILNAVATSAARYGLAVEPLLSLNIDFYARLFVRIRRSPVDVKFLASKTMVVYNCDHGCGSFSIQYMAQSRQREAKNGDKFYTHSLAQGPSATPHCEHCGFKTHLAGPMWGGPLHNPHFITKILDLLPSLDKATYNTIPRIEGMLTLALNETLHQETQEDIPQKSTKYTPITSLDPALRDPHPFFINPSILARTLHCPVPSEAALRGALLGLGYRTTRSHTEPGSIRTEAPWAVIWEIMREWVRQKHPIKKDALKRGMAGYEIMTKERSNRKLMDAKQELRQILDGAGDTEGLRVGIEAAIARLSQFATESKNENVQNGALVEENIGTQSEELKVIFDDKLGKEATCKRMVRYQMNPRPDWGPKSKARGE